MKVVVMGAGVIGVTTAYYLAKQGADVTVLERQPGPGLETSYANAGELSYGSTGTLTSPHLTIEENLAIAFGRGERRGFTMAVTGAKRQVFREELQSLELGLEDRLNMRVGMLSGGQRQALSLLMATYAKPAILLLDEHTAALDPSRAELITRLTKEQVARHNLTALMVTHNMQQAIELGNRLIMMHEVRIVLDVDEAAKKSTTPEHLLEEFGKIKGASLSDRTLLD